MRALAAAALAVLAGCASKDAALSDWERANAQREATEEVVAPPQYPEGASLSEFAVRDAAGFRYFVDSATLAVGKDGVVRYVLVARSPEGVENVTYEGLRCESAEQRVYALGHRDRTWSPARGDWRRIVQPRHVALAREYFCPQNEPIRTADEGRRALQGGGHPFSKGFGGEFGRGR
ncbi:MAG TPA: CNP1-like family protein [Burkholderiales bacterium]